MGSSRVCTEPSLSAELTSSITRIDTIDGSQEFRIDGYSLSKGIGIGKYIASDTFMVGGYLWAIYYYPDGKSPEDNANYVSLFIALASEGTDVRALFELKLEDQSGRHNHKIHSHFETGPYTLKYRGSMWGYKCFYKRTSLESSDYLKDDCLVITGTVGVVRSHTEGPKLYSLPVPPSDIGKQFGKLFESKKATDVTFEVDGELFAAHRVVLAAQSPVFRAQLFGPMREKSMNSIKVEDMEAPVFKHISAVEGGKSKTILKKSKKQCKEENVLSRGSIKQFFDRLKSLMLSLKRNCFSWRSSNSSGKSPSSPFCTDEECSKSAI